MLSDADTLAFLSQTLADFARAREQHPQALRDLYKRRMRTGEELSLPAPTRRTDDPLDGTIKFCLPAGTYGPAANVAAAPAPLPGAPLSQPPAVNDRPPAPTMLESESVIIPMSSFRGSSWFTLCISSQVGCRMACSFCETGRMGLLRNLSAGEIVRQRLVARQLRLKRMAANPPPAAEPVGPSPDTGKSATGNRQSPFKYFSDGIQNIVFMGMGEPLDNFDNVLQAIRVLSEPTGLNFPLAQISVSTVGRVDGLRKLAALCESEPQFRNLRIAISLNAAHDKLRDQLMPINKAMPLADLRQTLLDYPLAPRARFLIEYVLIKGVNDSAADASAVAAFCRDLPCVVNVIPYNPQRFATYETPSEETIAAFMSLLKSHGLFTKRRTTHGRDLMSACGQLGNPHIRRQPARI